jgi:hypothetical protein
LARFLGSVKAAILLCQLLYWHGKGEDDPEWFFKTIEELYEETGLTRYEQDSAIRKCKKRGFIEVRKKGIPSKRYFRVNLERLASELSKSYKL